MTDIVIVNPLTFLEYKDRCLKQASIDKYDHILNKYACFTTVVVFAAPRHTNDQVRHHQPKPNRKRDCDIVTRKQKDLRQIIRGMLNVINKTNYSKMLNKLRLLKSDSNINLIIGELLHTCTLQSFYIDTFVKLIFDIVGHCSDQERKAACGVLNAFVCSVVADRRWMHGFAGKEYDVFCDYMKHKSRVLAEHTLLIRLQELPCISVDLISLVEQLFHDLESCLKNQEECKSITIIQMLTYHIKTKKTSIPFNVEGLQDKCFTKQIQFAMEELSFHVEKNYHGAP